MRVELTRMVADWLLHPDFGVNRYLDTVPRDAGDPGPPLVAAWADPDQPQVSPVAVFDDTRHRWVVRREDPPAMPCLLVGVTAPIELTGEPYPDGQFRMTTADVELAIAYMTQQEDEVVAIRDGEYTLRAVARSLRELLRNDQDAARLRNSVRLIAAPTLRYVPLVAVVGAGRVSGAVVLSVHAEDGAPSWTA